MSRFQKLYKIAQYTTGTALGGAALGFGSWSLWSRKSYFEPFTPENDKLFHLPLLKAINPHNNPSLDDCCVRKVPLSKIKPEFVEDHQKGGSKLVTAFSQGMWGGYGFSIQRKLMNRYVERTEENRDDLWTVEDLLASDYQQGDVICDHLIVLSKEYNSIVMRGGHLQRDSGAPQPTEMDNIGELEVKLNKQTQEAEFRFKNIFFSGAGGPKDKPPIAGVVAWLHYQYCKLLVESGVNRCMK